MILGFDPNLIEKENLEIFLKMSKAVLEGRQEEYQTFGQTPEDFVFDMQLQENILILESRIAINK